MIKNYYFYIICLLLLLGMGCMANYDGIKRNVSMKENQTQNKVLGFDSYDSLMSKLNIDLNKEYQIKEFNFDTEIINNDEDLKEIIDRILNFAKIEYEFIESGKTSNSFDYYVSVEIKGKIFIFLTTTSGDWLDVYRIREVLNNITTWLHSKEVFRELNLGDETATLIFANHDIIKKVIKLGYPCCLGEEDVPNRAIVDWDSNLSFSIKIKHLFLYEDLKKHFILLLEKLNESKFLVPNYTFEQIYICDLFNESEVWFCINGRLENSGKTEGSRVKCDSNLYGLLLAYILVKHYDGVPFLVDRGSEKEVQMNEESFYSKILSSFKKND